MAKNLVHETLNLVSFASFEIVRRIDYHGIAKIRRDLQWNNKRRR